MSIALEFIDLIVPVALIRAKYPGGWAQCLEDHKQMIGGKVWYDDHLFRDGAMSPRDMGALVAEWEGLGFIATGERDGEKCFKDLCVAEGMLGGPTLTCDWLVFDPETHSAYLKEAGPGPVIGRASFSPSPPA